MTGDIDAAIQLGLVFKTSPVPFFDMPHEQLWFLLERTLDVTKRANPDRGE